jgi:hypothetical protein
VRKWKDAQLIVVVVVGGWKDAQLIVVVVVGERKDAQLIVVVVVGERKDAQSRRWLVTLELDAVLVIIQTSRSRQASVVWQYHRRWPSFS